MIDVFTIFGLPGSGKSVQGKLLKKEFDFEYFSIGNIAKEEIKKEIKLGVKIKPYVKKGKPIPDNLVIKIVLSRLKKSESESNFNNGLLMDNFPFNKNQAELWQKKVKEKYSFNDPWGIFLKTRESVIIKRLSKRLYCPKCHTSYNPDDKGYKKKKCPKCGHQLVKREDDRKEVIEERLKEYRKPVRTMTKYFEEKKKLIKIDGEKSIEGVFEDVKEKVEKVIAEN